MKKYYITIFLTLSLVIASLMALGRTAESATAGPQLVIAQLKITSSDGQFITLYNTTSAPIDLGKVQLQYYNNYDLAEASSSKLIKLSGQVPAHGYAVVSDGAFQACYRLSINSVSLGLSSTSGFIQVSHFLGSSPYVTSLLDDYVDWSKKTSLGAQTLPSGTDSFLQRQAPDGSQNYSTIKIPGDGNWQAVQQLGDSSPCTAGQASSSVGGGSLVPGTAAIPYTIEATAKLSSIPADDSGLRAPQISEVLPNPAPPKTDADDEFIELYNSNSQPFDLSGFVLQVGTTTVHKYTFPSGTTIHPKKFSAFYSSDTNLSLSNSQGRVELKDPGDNTLGKTDVYSNAKDGYAWVDGDGLWQWTTKPTPGAQNVISSPVTSKTNSSSDTPLRGVVQGAVTTSSGPNSGGKQTAALSLHPVVLAVIGAGGLLYALYEYRHDLANHLYKRRRNREVRRTAG
ncbi:MAG TPA: lamin tail domain-containing protein [Candidatus Saccharimonadales bacterium]|nr:lamin tail domain-containing protein [Candidatus Saccharimonadales bacterium]